MKLSYSVQALAFAGALVAASAAFAQMKIVKIDGSSTVFPVTEAVKSPREDLDLPVIASVK